MPGANTFKAAAIIAFFYLLHLVEAYKNSHSHQHIHHDEPGSNKIYSNYNRSSTSTANLTSAEILVSQGLAAVAIANKLRYENAQFNTNEFRNTSSILEGRKSAPPLNYTGTDQHTDSQRRSQITSSGNSSTSTSYVYSIPPQLAEAARIVAELHPPPPSNGNHSKVASELKLKYSLDLNDTNVMKQTLVKPNALFEVVKPEPVEFTEIINASLRRRDTSEYWMANIQQNGASPFAPPGYKVWRNVKDYGAIGDGVTDDTIAINRAISDGGRCGDNCGSSTIYPAVIWFPAGTYLVSGSIIQYYNTQFLGDPLDIPTIIAASSFVGLGVITSDVYTSDDTQWYTNQNNFLRSIKNFRIDITNTAHDAQICGIHWQVAQGTSLENIEFHMSFDEDTTQQGIYMENGSGGFLGDLVFVGGKFGAFFGNQQFTTSHLIFFGCATAMQIHWDWAWTMQDIVIEQCGQGIVIVGGAGGELSTGQPVGALILVDAIIANTPVGLVTTLLQENSTSLLLQNVFFENVGIAIKEAHGDKVIVAGNPGASLELKSWGFGMVSDASGNGSFINGQPILAMNRTTSLTAPIGDVRKQVLFTRRRPKYNDIGASQIIDVKMFGARGDGLTDDSAVLNSVLANAANMSSVVFFPFGVYIIKDTLKIPVGSRIIGQAWPQIMATGSKFQDAQNPHVAIQVGRRGDVGAVEIQDMMFTVSGPTAGAVVVEWNVHELSQGSAGLWDTHIRIGGAIGSGLQKDTCPKKVGPIDDCVAASLLFHLTQTSSAYIENAWIWVADHDLDVITQDQIDIFSARGVLIESQGPTWLYGTASEHNVLYQYQLSSAKDLLLGMIQTESPYFQGTPPAPKPFELGLFSNDPAFEDCTPESTGCGFSWGVRIIDSSTIYILGAGIYSWFSSYSQDCLTTENCQQRGIEIEGSHDVWLYNIATKAIIEMISPLKETPTYARDNVNGFLSSILAWLGGAEKVSGNRDFIGFQIYERGRWLSSLQISDTCRNALVETIHCEEETVRRWTQPSYHGYVEDIALLDRICDPSCAASISKYYNTVERSCAGYNFSGAPLNVLAGYIWQGLNETCHTDSNGVNCNNILYNYTSFSNAAGIPEVELCSECFVDHYGMMLNSPYSHYSDSYQPIMDRVYSVCGKPTDFPVSTDPLPPTYIIESPLAFCLSDIYYITQESDTCDSIALAYNVSSASLFIGNEDLHDCSTIKEGITLCIPLSCSELYTVRSGDTCESIERGLNLAKNNLIIWNSWIDADCRNLQAGLLWYGNIICLSPQGGKSQTQPPDYTIKSPFTDEYSYGVHLPPNNSVIATGTTKYCGRWSTIETEDSCTRLCLVNKISYRLFLQINPSLSETNCALIVGLTYCTSPIYNWDTADELDEESTSTVTSATVTSTPTCVTASGLLVSPTPSGAICGLKGTSYTALGTGTIIGYGSTTPYVVSIEACSAQCLATSCCTNFYFIQGSACNLKFGPNAFNENLAAPGGILFDFYDAACFSCDPLSCTSTASTATVTPTPTVAPTPTCVIASGLASPTPSTAMCGLKGTSYSSSGTGTIISYGNTSPYTASLAACSAQCLATACCTNVYFIQGMNCNLKFGPRAFNENLAAPGGILFDFYDATCFTCGPLIGCVS